MTAPIRPAGTKAFGRTKWIWVPALADPAAPKVTEIAAAGALDVSCYFYTTSGQPDISQNRVQAPMRVCDTSQYEELGIAQWQGGDLMYAVDPTVASSADGKKAMTTLAPGSNGFLVRRPGVDVATDVATGDYVTVFPAALGKQLDTTEGDGESAEVAIKQAFAITGEPEILVAVVAGP